MRKRIITTATTLAVLFSSVALLTATAGSAQADSTTDLPISSYTGTAVDGVHQHLFIGNGGQTVVTDYNGTVQGRITDLTGVRDMVLSPDSATLYAAVSGSDEIVAVDTATLAVTARYPTGDGTAPSHVALVGHTLWFGYGKDGAGNLGSVDLSGDTPAVTLDQAAGRSWYAPPALHADPENPSLLIAVDGTTSASPVVVYDVSAGTPSVGVAADTGGFARDAAVTPDGADLVVADGTHLIEYRLSDLSKVSDYPMPDTANGVAIAPDGTVAGEAANFDGVGQLQVFPGGPSLPASSRDLGDPTPWMPDRALSWAPDGSRLFAVTQAAGGSDYQLREFGAPRQYVTTETLTAPASATRAKPLTVSGKLTAGLLPPAGTKLTVTRSDLNSPKGTALAAATLGTDSAFSFKDTPYTGGTVTYTVSYAGNSTYTAASASAKVAVSRVAPTLTLDHNNTHYAYNSNVTFTAHLGTTSVRTVEFYSDPWGTDKPKTLVKKATVDASGNASVSLTKLTRNTSVTVVFDGDALHSPKTVQSTANIGTQVFTTLSKQYKTGKIGSVSYAYFHKNTDPLITTAMPYYPGRNQQLQLQVYDAGTWYDADSEYFPIDTTQHSAVSLEAPGESGIRARVRSNYIHGGSGDTVNDTTYGPWRYLDFTD